VLSVQDEEPGVEENVTRPRRAGMYALRLVGVLGLLPCLGALALVLSGPATWSGVAYAAGGAVFFSGLVVRVGKGGHGVRRHLAHLALAGLCLSALARCTLAGAGRTMQMGSPAGSARMVNRLFDEGDMALGGMRLLSSSRLLRDDRTALRPAMEAAYAELRTDQGGMPSPVVATYMGLQSPEAFDLMVLEPDPREWPGSPTTAVLFLHGFAGSFVLPCWQVAQVVGPLGVVTACPAMDYKAQWWKPEGEAIVRRTVDILRARGVQRIVLAGLSNGGIGASSLAARMRGSFAGVVLISGADPSAGPSQVPTLVLHGTHDTLTSFGAASAYASQNGARLVGLDAGHFAMLVRRREHDQALRAFVAPLARRGGAIRQ